MSKYLRSSDLAHEIASAVFRVAALTRHSRLRLELEGAAVELIKKIQSSAVDKLGRLVRFAEAVGEMSEINAYVLQRELENLQKMLNSEISESFSGTVDNLDLREIFGEKPREEEREERQEIKNQGKRQEAVLEYIRKFPNGCKMRRLSVAFPDFSERTIRTDVQRLIDKGLIEKIGSKTGPFSYFRAMDSTGSPQMDSPDLQLDTVDLEAGLPVTKEELFSL